MITRLNNKVLRTMRPLTLVTIIFLLIPPNALGSPQSKKPITKERLIRSLKIGGVGSEEYVQLIKKHGVDFLLTPDVKVEIRRVGKKLGKRGLDSLIAAVRGSYRPETDLIKKETQPKDNQTPDIMQSPSGLKVNGIMPNSGETTGGNTVTIFGLGFSSDTKVNFDGVPAQVIESNSVSLKIKVPAHVAGAVNVAVTNPDSTKSAQINYTYSDSLTVTGITPVSGATTGGTMVVINGAGFTQGMIVRFGGTPATITQLSSTTITTITPPKTAGAVEVTIIDPSRPNDPISLPSKFTYIASTLTIESIEITFYGEGTSKGFGDSIEVWVYENKVEVGHHEAFGKFTEWKNSATPYPNIPLHPTIPINECGQMSIRILKDGTDRQWNISFEVKGMLSDGPERVLQPRTSKIYKFGGGNSPGNTIRLMCP